MERRRARLDFHRVRRHWGLTVEETEDLEVVEYDWLLAEAGREIARRNRNAPPKP